MAHAGLTFKLDLTLAPQGQWYFFSPTLITNASLPAAPVGTYVLNSPQWPTNGASCQCEITGTGMALVNLQEFGYGDLATACDQITNGTWTILFKSATTTNLYTFLVTAPMISSNVLPATTITFPAAGAIILPSQTNFTWQGATDWPVMPLAQVYTYNHSYYQWTNVLAGLDQWNLTAPFEPNGSYSFDVYYQTNYTTPLFLATTPLSTNDLQPIAGWDSATVLESSSSVSFSVVTNYGAPERGHTCLAYYTFEDNNLFAHDFSGNENNLSYAWFGAPPTIVTNDAADGSYAGGFGGSGWFTPPDSLRSLFAGSFSVSLWLQTTNVHGLNTDGQHDAAGIVSDLNGNENLAVLPLGQTGRKVAFYTGGSSQNLLRSQADINSGHYIHVVVTRDRSTGEKRIYINGALDSSVHAATNWLDGSDSGGLTIGFNNFNVFVGQLDEIQFYSGVLASNEVVFLHSHPGTKVADTIEVSRPLARYDFEDTNSPGMDSSGHHNDANCGSGNGGTNLDLACTGAVVGSYARQFFGDTSICFTPGGSAFPHLSNALAGSFSVTAWINTTNSTGADNADATFGSPILSLYNSGTNGATPLSITGSKAAFTVYDPNGNTVTLHSTTAVNDGVYHFLSVTRDQASGLIRLFVDGNLQATGMSTPQPLPLTWIYLAGSANAFYQGLLDDVRIYAGPLDANDIASLYGRPTFDAALTTGLVWSVAGGDTAWFVETNNASPGSMAAAQSGRVTNNQVSSLSTTVTGPGTLTFYWSSIANDPNQGFDYEFYVDDVITGDTADLYGSNDWTQAGPFAIPAGPHTLGWIVYANGDTNSAQAGFLDRVSFIASKPANLINAQTVGANFQFSFQSQNGFSYDVQYCTNLVAGSWQTYNTIVGDGAVKTVPLPLSLFNSAQQAFVRVATQ